MSQGTAWETRVSEQERVIAQLRQEVALLRRSAGTSDRRAEQYRKLFDALEYGFCLIQMIFDEHGKAVDYRFLEVNLAFERQTGLRHAVGRTMRSLVPDHEPRWFESYGEVARSGEPRRFDEPAVIQGRYFDVFAFRFGEPEERKVGVLFGDISVRREAEAAQQEALAMKDRFLANLAHELRNPLAPLQSGIEVLRMASADSPRNPAEEARVLEIMSRQIGHLRHLMDELLDVSRISTGAVTLQKEPVDLLAAVRKAVEYSSAAIYDADRQVTIELPSEPLMVNGDRDRLAQLVAGLLDNAGKFTAPDGHIRVVADRYADQARLRVQDDGVGIDPHMLNEIFGMFSQGSTDRHGLGIGLTVVRDLVELHDGSVEARSRGRGAGSEFVVLLPLSHSTPKAPADARRAPTLPALERQRVLVVDDNRDAADSLAVLLGSMGAEVRTAYDGRTALLLLDELQPQIVFLDIGMPEMDGYEVARRMRLRQAGDALLLVAVTGWGQPTDRERARKAGFDQHLLKPATLDDLRQVMAPREAGPSRAYSTRAPR